MIGRAAWLHRDCARAVSRQQEEIDQLRAELAGRGEADPEAFFEALMRARLGAGYGPVERYRDFRRVFAGPAGRRVLWQILEWAHLFRPVAVRGDSSETYRRDGVRNIGLRILATLNAEPLDRAEQAQNQQG